MLTLFMAAMLSQEITLEPNRMVKWVPCTLKSAEIVNGKAFATLHNCGGYGTTEQQQLAAVAPTAAAIAWINAQIPAGGRPVLVEGNQTTDGRFFIRWIATGAQADLRSPTGPLLHERLKAAKGAAAVTTVKGTVR